MGEINRLAIKKQIRLKPVPSSRSEKKIDRLTHVLCEALRYTANEPTLFAQSEEFLSPKLAKLEIDRPLGNRINKVIEQIGGVPRLIMYRTGDALPRYDTYGGAAIREILDSFQRCRRSVCRTHVCFIGAEFGRTNQDILQDLPKKVKKELIEIMAEVFWEHAETSYVRLASYWDRVGQFLDYIFFNIRQYERDGFPAVMDRISSNYVRLFPGLDTSTFWLELRRYQNSQKPTGFQWLLRRRNLLVHSLHLGAIRGTKAKENPIFTSAYNHLEESVHKKLQPESPESELGYLHEHLSIATRLFSPVIELCEHCAALTRKDIARDFASP